MAVTLTRIAREVGVSPCLVSRFYKGDKTLRISEKRVKEILEAEKRLGGRRIKHQTQGLVPKLAHNILAPIKNVHTSEWFETFKKHSLFGLLMQNVDATLKAAQFRFSISFFDPDDQIITFKSLMDSPDYCDGLLILSGVPDESLAGLLLDRDFPHVSIDPRAEELGINSVSVDAVGGLRQAVAHLQELDHERIGFFGPSHEEHNRYPMFSMAMASAGLEVNERNNCFVPSPQPDDASKQWLRPAGQKFNEWLSRGEPPTALVCQNDDLALLAIDVMRQKGLCPGRDISVIGYDNIEQRGPEPSTKPIVTTIDNPVDAVGQRCGERLLNQILHKQKDVIHQHVPTQLIVRESTGPCVKRVN